MPLPAGLRAVPPLVVGCALGGLLASCRPAADPSGAVDRSVPAQASESSASSGRDDVRAFAAIRAFATIREVMEDLIDPSADAIWESVQIEATLAGTTRKAPQSEAEWAAVRRHASTIAEAANLLLVPGREVAPPGNARPAEGSVDLPPAAVAALIARDRGGWATRAHGLQDAAAAALKAADAKDVGALLAAGETLDTACEVCHAAYWYPAPVRP